MDMNFLKEYVYFKLEDKIRKYQAKVQERREKELIKAKKSGAVFECQVCYDPDGLLKEVAMCAAGCMICRCILVVQVVVKLLVRNIITGTV